MMQDAEAKYERCYIRRVVMLGIGAIVLGAGLLGFCSQANAEPIYKASAEGTTITLHTADCKMPAVKNLPKRAVWEEGGVKTEGCYGPHPQFPVVVFYFSDRTVVIVPVQLFQRVTGT